MKLQLILLVLLVAELDLRHTKRKNKRYKLNSSDHNVPSSNLDKRELGREHFTEYSSQNNSKSENIDNTFLPSKAETPCPEGFTSYNEDESACYQLTEKQPFPPKCPYPNYLSTGSYYGKEFFGTTIWMMAKRNTEDSFGPFEKIEHGTAYGNILTRYAVLLENITEKNCMVVEDNQYVPVSCNDKHHALCVYPYGVDRTNKYCQRHYGDSNGYTNCISDGLNIENNRCYCERVEAQEQTPEGTRDLFCNALAEPLTPFQNHILLNQLKATKSRCWFGLNNEDGMLKWTVSDTKPNYTNWCLTTDFSKPFGAVQHLDNSGWILADDDGTIQCGLCELQNVYDKNVSIRLKYNPSMRYVEMRIKNPFELSDLFGYIYELYVFVGPLAGGPIKRLLKTYTDFGKVEESGDYTEKFSVEWGYPTYYWCEGFQHPNHTPVHSNKILTYNTEGEQEYAIQLMVRTIKDKDPYLNDIHDNARVAILKAIEVPNQGTLRVMKVLKFDQTNSYIEMIMHLTTEKVENETAEYDYLEQCFNHLIVEVPSILNITRFGRSDVCLPSKTISGNKTLHWPKTIIGAVTLSIEVCLQDNGAPVMRKCEGDFWKGGAWSEVIGTCSDDKDLSERSQELNNLLNNENLTPSELSGNLSRITEDNTGITVVDVYLISGILERLETVEDEVSATDVVTVISNVMNFEPKELKQAQEVLNSTDKILHSFDKLLTNSVDHDDEEYKYQMVTSKRVLVQSSDVSKTNITGVALQGNSEDNDFDTYKLILIYKNTSLEALLDENIELAAFLPRDLLLELESCLNPGDPIKTSMVLFHNDVLFNENVEMEHRTNSRILNILIHNFHCTFSTPIPIIFRPLGNTDSAEKCVHWYYGVDDNMENNIEGRWLEDGLPETDIIHRVCKFDHVTHFALLMMGSLSQPEPSEANTMALDVITAIGSILSLTSILAMFLMVIFLKNWRGGCSNKIILNFSLAVALQIILLYVASNIQEDGTWCTIAGTSLHYTVLSEFCWMLVIAILQYRKFVIVFQEHIPNFVGMACVFCWCVPFIPIVILLAISSDSYQINEFGLCYPSGKYFYFGVVLPISIIWASNFFVFVRIICAVCHKKVDAYGPKQDESKLQIVLALFLFFMLGISWVFGLAVGFGGRIWLAYLFCFTATFQGFVMFIFFIAMNEKSRKVWINIKGGFVCRNQNKRLSKSSSSSTEYSYT